jgi:hypothetical protein
LRRDTVLRRATRHRFPRSVLPFITSISRDLFGAVPSVFREAACGHRRSQRLVAALTLRQARCAARRRVKPLVPDVGK